MLKIGTRGSKLATTQAGHQRDAINAAGYESELHIVTTAGDVNMAPVERIGVGVFTAALREALYAGECDIAVHSFKDLPTAYEPRTHLITPVREDRREALIARDGLTLDTLPEGARVGTSAPRRISQLKAHRPDLNIQPLRGNIDTRMGKVTSGELDAVVLAYAGISRVGMSNVATQVFEPTEIMPAPAQGALAVEARVDDQEARAAIDVLADHDVLKTVTAERTVLATLEAGCTAPVASYADLDGDTLTLHAGVFALDGSRQLVHHASGSDPVSLGQHVAQALLEQGAASIIG